MNFNPINSSISELMLAIEKQNDLQKYLAQTLAFNSSAVKIAQQFDISQQLSASAANNIALFAGQNSITEMARYLEMNKINYSGYLSVSSDMANIIAKSMVKPNPTLNAWTSGIGNILAQISYPEIEKKFTVLDAVMGSSFINFSRAMEGITRSDYDLAMDTLKNNQDIQRVIQETLSPESIESFETEEGYKSLESILGEKLSAISGINKIIIAFIIYFVFQMLNTVIKKETEITFYGDSTKKIITALHQQGEQIVTHTDSISKLSEDKKPADNSFMLYSKSDCKVFNRNSIKSKVIYTLHKEEAVIALEEFRKWDKVQIKTGSEIITGFVLKSDLKEK